MPGNFYNLIGEFLGEKLPMIIFTNKVSFKVSLSYQIEYYELQRQSMVYQGKQVEAELQNIYNDYDNRQYSDMKFELCQKNKLDFMNMSEQDWNHFLQILHHSAQINKNE